MNVLVDTSIWIDHFNKSDLVLVILLNRCQAYTHPFVIGELACGQLRKRNHIIELLGALPVVSKVDDDEVLHFMSQRQLYGKGLGLIDIHLLASCCIDGSYLWTRDKKLKAEVEMLCVSYMV